MRTQGSNQDDPWTDRRAYPVLDMPEAVINEVATPPKSPAECIFARTTETISADVKVQGLSQAATSYGFRPHRQRLA